MVAKVDLLIPAGEAVGGRKADLAPRLESLKGLTVAIFSNSWQCMNHASEELRVRLIEDYGVKEVIRYESPLTLPMPTESMNDAVARCDAAIVGMGT